LRSTWQCVQQLLQGVGSTSATARLQTQDLLIIVFL
jgi:hypothetical protein